MNLTKQIRPLFTGRAKLITIPILVVVALAFWPFAIGGLLAYAAYRYIPQKKLKYAAIVVIIIPTIFIGNSWVSGFLSDSSNTKTVSKQSISAPVVEVKEAEKETPVSTTEVVEEVVAGANSKQRAAPAPTTDTQPAAVEGIMVKRVIDGDTIELETGETIRYIGIDTPETVHPNKPVQCFGKEATAKNTKLVEGKRVRLEKDVSETDHYGRLLLYVYVDDIFVNDYLVRQGYANSSSYPPDVKYQDQFRQAEQEARTNKRGLWSSCATGSSDTSSAATKPAASTVPVPAAQPATSQCDIKGNISQTTDEKIYHVLGCASYNKTVIDTSSGERYFCTEAEAVAAGWRKALNCP